MSTASSRSSKGGYSSGTDPIVKDKEGIKKLTPLLIKFLSEISYICTDIDFKRSLPQLRNLPTARLVREIYNFFFQELLGITLEKKVLTEIVLEYLKELDYPFVIPKSSITSPNNSSSWPYNFAAFIYLKDLYIAAGLFQTADQSESFSDTLGVDIEEDNINVFDDKFMKSFAILTDETEDIVELKRMTNILASNDMQFRALNAEVKDLRNAKKSLEDELRGKQATFASLFGSVEEFEEILNAVKEKETLLSQLREEVESVQKDETDCILACRRARDKIQAMRDDWQMKLKLHFPEFCDKFCDLLTDTEKKLCETTSELRADLGRKMKLVLQKKTELKELHGLRETSIFRLRHEHETLQEDCIALKERVDKIRETMDRWYKVIDRCDAQIEKQSQHRDQLAQNLQQDYKAAQLLFTQKQSELDRFVAQMVDLDQHSGLGDKTKKTKGGRKQKKNGKS